MKKLKYFGLFLSILFLFSCSSKSKIENEIKELEDNLFSETSGMIDRDKTATLVEKYILFADKYPADSKAPEYLFKAADISMNLINPQQAIDLFDRIMEEYPDFEKYPHCLFLKGYVYENEIGNLGTAKQIYETFLIDYPDHEFADDVQISLEHLGKSPEELIREFQEKAQSDSLQNQ